MNFQETFCSLFLSCKFQHDRVSHEDYGLHMLSPTAVAEMAKASAGLLDRDEAAIRKLSGYELAYVLYWGLLKRTPEDTASRAWAASPVTNEIIQKRFHALESSHEANTRGRRPFAGSMSPTANPEGATLYVDVTNTVETNAWTGIQRVVRNISAKLSGDEDVVFCKFDAPTGLYFGSCDFQSLFDEESERSAIIFCRGDIFFDIDGSWSDPLPRPQFYRELKRNGIVIYNVHYDAVPLIHSDFSHPSTILRFIEHLAALITYSDRVFCISRAVEEQFQRICEQLKLRCPPSELIQMGFHFSKNHTDDARAMAEAAKGPFALCVGTVEPRKNYGLVVDNLEGIKQLGLRVVIVGKAGWEVEAFLSKLSELNDTSPDFTWMKDADDDTLSGLYAQAAVLLVPSIYEGFGLPVLEGIARGCPVLVSDGGALPEALSHRAALGRVFRLSDPDSLLQELAGLLTALKGRRNDFQEGFSHVGWSSAVATVKEAARSTWSKITDIEHSATLLYISIRAADFKHSIESFLQQQFPVKNVVVLTNQKFRKEFLDIFASIPIEHRLIMEDDIIDAGRTIPKDHQERNFFLRQQLYQYLADEYEWVVACDDDALLMEPIDLSHFIRDDSCRAFYYKNSMNEWRASPFEITSFDRGQWQTGELLYACGYQDKSYASHRPQLVNLRWFSEIARELRFCDAKNFCEWSTYFNIAQHRFPLAFKATKSTVLGWPENMASWLPDGFSDEIVFHNRSDHLIHSRRDWREACLRAAATYNSYHYQRMFCGLFVDSIKNIKVVNENVLIDGTTLYAFRDLWRSIDVTTDAPIMLGYVVKDDDVIIVDGRWDTQYVGDRVPLMIKMPAGEGEYSLELINASSEIVARLTLIVLPCALIK